MSYTLLLIKYQYDTSKKSSIFCTNCLNKLSSTTTNTNTTSTDTTTTDNSSNIITTDHSSMLHIHHSNMLSLSTFIPDPSLILFCAVQLLILMLCFMTVPHRHHHHRHMVNHYNSDCCTPNTNKLSQLFSCSPIQSNYNTVTTTTTTTTNMVISSWLPNDLNCKIIPTLGLFYLDKNEENYTLTLSSKNLTSSSPYFTCELTRLLLWLEQGKPAGLKINIHLSYLMGQFFLYHLLAWPTIHSINNHNHNNNYYYIINMITIICLLMSTIYIMATISIYQYKQYYPHYYHYHYHYYYYYIIFIFKLFLMCFSLIIRLMLRLMFSLLLCLLLDTIELITLHLTSFYIFINFSYSLLRLQLKTIAASWRLCRNSSKWNPLRNRVDKIPDIHQSERSIMGQKNILYKFISHKKDSDIILCDQLTKQTCGLYLDRLLVSTLLGLAIGLCLFTTTIAFYITFTSVTRIDFNEMYQQNHLLHKPIFPSKSLSFMNIFYCLLSAQDIR
ncbi:Hypothetical protein, putative [Schistosoma mansoni]|uniref:Hypothetical protein, putative n=1 Tax=Schistosoma mansoni TaxID=6183 RepID=UPI00022C8778|nr:Hypothetical protein, putative [Schistosoma mansoni]|eukprot:XP_018646280.1 Hypothetical protein, putative [Schistosoma mansoni]